MERKSARHAVAGDGCSVRDVGRRGSAGSDAATGGHHRCRVDPSDAGTMSFPSRSRLWAISFSWRGGRHREHRRGNVPSSRNRAVLPLGTRPSSSKYGSGCGVIDEQPPGTYQYRKWHGTCTIQVLALEIEEQLLDWPEAGTRRREQLTVDDARQRGRRGEPETDLRPLHRMPAGVSRRREDASRVPLIAGRRQSATASRRTRCHANSTCVALFDEGSRT